MITQTHNGATSYERDSGKLLETLLVYTLVIASVCAIQQMELRGQSILIPTMWAIGALLPGWSAGSNVSHLGLREQRLAVNTSYFVYACVILLPLYGAGLWLLQYWGMPQTRVSIAPGVSLVEWILYQFALVAVFEELFFRGYLQHRLERGIATRIASKMLKFWFPVVASAALFALAHVIVDLDPASATVFVPGLVFAWLRATTGSLVAPILCHGSFNVFLMFALETLYG